MNNEIHTDNDNSNAAVSITPEQLKQQLRKSGYEIPGGLFATEAGAAWLFDCSVRTLRRWRAKGKGPKPMMTKRWVYLLDEICAWLNSRNDSQIAGQERPNADT